MYKDNYNSDSRDSQNPLNFSHPSSTRSNHTPSLPSLFSQSKSRPEMYFNHQDNHHPNGGQTIDTRFMQSEKLNYRFNPQILSSSNSGIQIHGNTYQSSFQTGALIPEDKRVRSSTHNSSYTHKDQSLPPLLYLKSSCSHSSELIPKTENYSRNSWQSPEPTVEQRNISALIHKQEFQEKQKNFTKINRITKSAFLDSKVDEHASRVKRPLRSNRIIKMYDNDKNCNQKEKDWDEDRMAAIIPIMDSSYSIRIAGKYFNSSSTDAYLPLDVSVTYCEWFPQEIQAFNHSLRVFGKDFRMMVQFYLIHAARSLNKDHIPKSTAQAVEYYYMNKYRLLEFTKSSKAEKQARFKYKLKYLPHYPHVAHPYCLY